MKRLFGILVLVSFLSASGNGAIAQTPAIGSDATALATDSSGAIGKGVAALDAASKAGKYLFIFFQDGTASQPSEFLAKFVTLTDKEAASSSRVVIDRKNPAEQAIVAKFQVDRAPMPLVLAVAPNGAVTSGFPAVKLSEESIREAVVSKGMQECLGILQQGKLVLLSLQSPSTTSNAEAMTGAKEFCADPQFGPAAGLVSIDPSDAAEAAFLKKLNLSSTATEAQTILLAPPAVMIDKFSGAVTKDAIAAALKKASSGGGCGSGGCGPSGCGN